MNKKVLIVEDNAIIAEQTKMWVEDVDGFDVEAIAYDFATAKHFIQNRTFDLALLDINLGEEKTGFDVAKLLIEKNTKFMYISSYADEKTLKKAKTLPPVAYMVKPIVFQTIKVNLLAFKN